MPGTLGRQLECTSIPAPPGRLPVGGLVGEQIITRQIFWEILKGRAVGHKGKATSKYPGEW